MLTPKQFRDRANSPRNHRFPVPTAAYAAWVAENAPGANMTLFPGDTVWYVSGGTYVLYGCVDRTGKLVPKE